MCWGLGWNDASIAVGFVRVCVGAGHYVPGAQRRQLQGQVSSPFVIVSPWLSCANKAEREGEDSSFLPSFSKSGGGPGGGGGGGGGRRPGPGERADNTDVVDATGPCGREKMESTTSRPMFLLRAGILPMSVRTCCQR